MSPDDADDFERTLALGKQLAQDLDTDDILGRWMAHHLSDLIMRAENSTEPQVESLRRETADLIIRLWEHRFTSPLRSRPTAALLPVMDALQRLGDTAPWTFYGMFAVDTGPDGEDIADNALLRIALELETTVRATVRNIIVTAAEQATDTEAPWLTAAAHLRQDDQTHLAQLIRRARRRRLLGNGDTEQGDPDTTGATPNTGQKTDPLVVLRWAEGQLESLTAVVRRHITAIESTNAHNHDEG